MKGRGLIAVACLVTGVPVAAYGLSYGPWPLILVGLALVLGFVFLAYEWLAGGHRPMGAEPRIRPADKPAWTMKDEPARPARDDRKK